MSRATVTIDGLVYAVRAGKTPAGLTGVRRVPLTSNAFPEAVPQLGTPKLENLLSARQIAFETPWGVGLYRGNDAHRVWDEENANSLFGFLTPGPLKVTPTFTGAPATFKSNPPGFIEALDTLFMFGFGAATTDEPVWSWVGSTTTWTNSTLNADTAATFATDVSNIAGMAVLANALYAIVDSQRLDAGNSKHLLKSSTLGVWSLDHTAATPDAFPDEGSSYFLLAMTDNKLRSLSVSEGGAGARTIKETDITPGAATTWTTIGTITNASSAPRGYVLWHDYAGAETTFITTSRYLYKGGATPVRILEFRHRRGTYTGRMLVGPDDRLYFLDGPNVGRLEWTTAGSPIVTYIGPHSLNNAAARWDGLPLARQGDVTALAISKAQPWLYVAVGGLAAARNASVMIFDTSASIEKAWHGPYKNATAQRAILAMFESAEDDGIPRLHIVEEGAAGGTQAPQHFNYITDNPKTQTLYQYATAPVVRTSRMDAGLAIVKKGFYKAILVGDDFTATEKVTVKFAKNGGALGTGQDITASPSGRWAGVRGTHTGAANASVLTDSAAAFIADGVTIGDVVYNITDDSNGRITALTATTITAALAGGTDNDWDASDVYVVPKGLEAYDVDVELALARGGTNTLGVKVAGISIAYDVVVLKDDGTPLFGYEMVISRNKDDYVGIERSAEKILSDLYTSFAKGTFLALNYREGQTEINTTVKMEPLEVVQVPVSHSDSGPAAEVGDIRLRLQERI